MQGLTEDIIRQAAAGDSEAFEAIYKACSGFVFNVACRVVNSAEDAREVAQDVFLTVHQQLKNFRFQSTFKTWSYRITINTAINYAKKKTREQNRMVEYTEATEYKHTMQNTDSGADRLQEQMLISLLDKLTADQRACLVLRGIEGLSYQEIADILDININTVRSRIKRARETLLAFRQKVGTHEL